MTEIMIDDQPYELENLSDELKQQLQMLQATDRKLAELNLEMAITQTARMGYAQAVKDLLGSSGLSSGTTV